MEHQKSETNEIVEEGGVLHKEFEFIPNALCQFKQRGPYLVCVSCDLQHAVYIGMKKLMIGVDDHGKPILKDRDSK